jgi:hypothetical protein
MGTKIYMPFVMHKRIAYMNIMFVNFFQREVHTLLSYYFELRTLVMHI